MKNITLIGSTGSIGTQTLDVCRKYNIKILGLAAHSNTELLAEQAREFLPQCVCIYDETKYKELKNLLFGSGIEILCGMDGLCRIAKIKADLFVNAVVGMVGLLPTLTAIDNKTNIALANKETLVAGGELVMLKARENNVKILPIDSEHSAIFQCLQGSAKNQVKKLILTASGGPFFGKTKAELAAVTLAQALNHPTWNMGGKITIDSATLMNKGLEFIEAVRLFGFDFGVTPDDIEIVIHRESVLHSAVEFDDNSVIAQLGVPDMKIPIQYALLYPDRLECDVKPLSLTDYGTLSFYKPDFATFDCLRACIEAVKIGGSAPTAVNAANEEAVRLFLAGQISFLEIGESALKALKLPILEINDYEDVIKADRAARVF